MIDDRQIGVGTKNPNLRQQTNNLRNPIINSFATQLALLRGERALAAPFVVKMQFGVECNESTSNRSNSPDQPDRQRDRPVRWPHLGPFRYSIRQIKGMILAGPLAFIAHTIIECIRTRQESSKKPTCNLITLI